MSIRWPSALRYTISPVRFGRPCQISAARVSDVFMRTVFLRECMELGPEVFSRHIERIPNEWEWRWPGRQV